MRARAFARAERIANRAGVWALRLFQIGVDDIREHSTIIEIHGSSSFSIPPTLMKFHKRV